MKREELFRFVNVRPIQKASDDRVAKGFATYDEGQRSPLHQQIAELKGPDAREKAITLGKRRLAADDGFGKNIVSVIEAARKGAAEKKVADAKKAVRLSLDTPLSDYLKNKESQALKEAIWDRLYAHTLAPEEKPEERELIYDAVRAFHFFEFLSKQADIEKPISKDELSAVMPTIPLGVIPEAPMVEVHRDDPNIKKALTDLDALQMRVQSLEAAIEDIGNANRIIAAQKLRSRVEVSAADLSRFQPARTVRLTETVIETSPVEAAKASLLGAGAAKTVKETPLMGKSIVVPKTSPWIFEEAGQKTLNKNTNELLMKQKSALTEMEVPEIVASLKKEQHNLVAEYIANLQPEAIQPVLEASPFKYLLGKVAIPFYGLIPVQPPPAPGSAFSRGIKPLGIGDLLIVKQELLRYVTGEVAHIENVMKTEFMSRSTDRLDEVEETVITETEQMQETEKDLQTTERFELTKESQKTLEEQMKLDAGMSLTASYGPVSLTAHADFALNQSTSESNRTSSTYAKQVTERSVSHIMQRTREQRTRRSLQRYEEKNEHGFDNKAGAGHVIGVYRWVDKYYKARLINYGRRLMIEFIVPEPAAFYLYLQAHQTVKGVTMEKPTLPMVSGRPLEPTDLNQSNYGTFVAEYNVQDIDPYPAEVKRISAAFAEATGGTENVGYAKVCEKLEIPKDYKCYDVFGESYVEGYDGYYSDILIAGQRWGSVTASEVQGIVPISVVGWFLGFHVNVVAICQLTPEAKKAWQLKTFGAIMNAYDKSLADYSEQVAAAQVQAGVAIEGKNPDFNRKIERDELRKGVLRLLTNNFAKTRVGGVWRFNEMFNAMHDSGMFGYPEFAISEALVEGKIIQFFEQAFEWSNMTYIFYPYFWGRMDKWKDIFPLTDIDPLFIDFLRAGSARVIVPVHPSYNETILHYMATNEIWNGGNPPTLYDPLYISIVDELKADSHAELDGDLPACDVNSPYPCLADEWEMKLPTTLVYLQEDAKLPDFTM
jgi:hypothetical protein